LRSLNRSGRIDTENALALARLVYWASIPDLDGETADMARARERMLNGAWMFECAVNQAKEGAVKVEGAGAK